MGIDVGGSTDGIESNVFQKKCFTINVVQPLLQALVDIQVDL